MRDDDNLNDLQEAARRTIRSQGQCGCGAMMETYYGLEGGRKVWTCSCGKVYDLDGEPLEEEKHVE